jgi:PhnB protein
MKRNVLLNRRVLSILIIVGCTASVLGLKNDNSSRGSKQKASDNSAKIQMTTLSTYILFKGNCKEAMEFYRSVFGGRLIQTSVGESPMKNSFPESMYDRIVNARLIGKNVDISASDWLRPTETPVQGNMVCLYLSGGKPSELKAIFEKLSVGANVTDPLRIEPFGTYRALNDKFGVRWMFQTDQKD